MPLEVMHMCSFDDCSLRITASASSMKLCGNCKTNYYCSKTCQRADWSLHKAVCVKDNLNKRICRNIQKALTLIINNTNLFQTIKFDSKSFDLTIKFFCASDAIASPTDVEILRALVTGIGMILVGRDNYSWTSCGRFELYLLPIPANLTRENLVINIISGKNENGCTTCSLEVPFKDLFN